MEHTKKFVLVDPRFVRPSMRDKVLSEMDKDISNILNSDDSDEVKAKRYSSALTRFKTLVSPPKPAKPPVPQPPVVQAIPSVSFKAVTPPKRPHKRVKVEPVASAEPATTWRRTLRTPTKKKFGTQWVTLSETKSRKKKSLKDWIV
jgi:hypothetical protein